MSEVTGVYRKSTIVNFDVVSHDPVSKGDTVARYGKGSAFF